MAGAAQRATGARPGASTLRALSRMALALLLLAAVAGGLLWWIAPYLLAPVDDFAQGTGDPIQRVRGALDEGEITVEAVILLPRERVPERLRGPIGQKLWLEPIVTEGGLVQFRIARAHAGQIPVPPALIRLADRLVPTALPGFDARAATLSLPLGDMVSRTLGRNLAIKRIWAEDGQLHLTIAMLQERDEGRAPPGDAALDAPGTPPHTSFQGGDQLARPGYARCCHRGTAGLL